MYVLTLIGTQKCNNETEQNIFVSSGIAFKVKDAMGKFKKLHNWEIANGYDMYKLILFHIANVLEINVKRT